jgi:diadenosine tetraphosphatase ApaH/serine/threonine PP2A family protein phosphatase
MIQTLLKSLRRGAKPPPVGSRIYAISDIHRRAGLLARLHRVILADADAPAAGPAADPARRDEDLMWIRDDFLDSRADHGHVVVHGHSINHRPEQRRNRFGIDTDTDIGAFTTGRLTCLVLEGATQRFIAT